MKQQKTIKKKELIEKEEVVENNHFGTFCV